MAKSSRAYKSAKRSKELDRQRKREEKRLRRAAGKIGQPAEEAEKETPVEDEIIPGEDPDPNPIIPAD